MPDDKSLSGGQDGSRIDVNENDELRAWAKKFRVTPEQLKEAVRRVGTSADAVEKHFKSGSL